MIGYTRGLRPSIAESLGDFLDVELLKIQQAIGATRFLVVSAAGSPSDGQLLVRTRFPRPLNLSARDTVGVAEVAPTADAVFLVQVSGVTVGTITFAAGETEPTIDITDPKVPAMRLLEVYAPNPADAALSNVELALALQF